MQATVKRGVILHPFLIAAYPVIALLAHNIEEVKPVVALRALALSVSASVLLYSLLRSLLKNPDKSAVITTLIITLFFSYGHVYDYLETTNPLGLGLGRHRLLAPLWGVFLILSILWVWRRGHNLRSLNQVLNWVAAAAVLMPLLQLGLYTARTNTLEASASHESTLIQNLKLPNDSPPPDIYYIILDAYARDDVLLQDHNLNNEPFLNDLENLGFYIARCSQSNYSQTQLSLASSLNIDYLQSLGEQFQPGNISRIGLDELIRNGQVRKALEDLGYSTVAFETGFKYTQWEDADYYYSPSAGVLDRMQIGGGLNDFESMLLKTSAGLLLSDSAAILPQVLQADFNNPRRIHRERILFDLDQLSQLPEAPGPKLVFAHLVSPHPPYVFGPGGEFTDYDLEAKKGYVDQINYLNGRLVPIMREIIEKSEVPPVIILQADHGAIHSPPNKRLNILNAYFLPGETRQKLYQGISPVNSFRLIFNEYFGGSYPLLEDTAYFSNYKTPYDLTVITDERPECTP